MGGCDICKRAMPEVSPFQVGKELVPVCPICALKKVNESTRVPLETPFAGTQAHAMFKRAVEFLGKQAPRWAKRVAAMKKLQPGAHGNAVRLDGSQL